MLVALKTLNIKNMVIHTKWKTTDYWLGAARSILNIILLERLL